MLDETQLLKGLKKGSREAVDELLNQYQHYIFTICLSVLKMKEEAEEATQDTFLKILKAVPEFDQRGKLTTWIYPIAYRTALDYLKKRKPTKELITDSDIQIEVINESETGDRMDRVQRAINALPPEEAGLIRMFYLEQLSIKELSEYLEMTESNLKVKLYRTRKKIMTLVNQ